MIGWKTGDAGHPKYLSAYSVKSERNPSVRYHVSCVHDCDGLVAEAAFCEITSAGGVAEAYGNDERLSRHWRVRKAFSLGEFEESDERRCPESGRLIPRTAFDGGFDEMPSSVISRRLSR